MSCNLLNDSNSSSAQSEDQQEMTQILDEEDLTYFAMDDGAESTFGVDSPSWDGGGLNKITDGFFKRPVFGRRVTERSKHIDINFTSDTTAQATVTTKFIGKFISLVTYNGDSLSLNRFEKPMEHDVVRIINFAKYTNQHRDTSRVNPGRLFRWRIVNVSMCDGLSNPSTVSIVEVVIKPQGRDAIVITDPLEYFINRKSVLTLPVLSDVKVQVKVENRTQNPVEFPAGSGSYENLRLQYGRNRYGDHAKKPFEYAGIDDHGYRIYEGTWTVRQKPGTHHAFIDLIDNGTILNEDNNAYPYSSATWGMPYVVIP